jgi:hypothetical protein
MNAIIKSHYVDTTVTLDGNLFEECSFVRCKLEYSGIAEVVLTSCIIDDCEFAFVGPASNTLQFLSAMYKDGPSVVEGIFQAIRNGQREVKRANP